jgi:magnesium chelatase subunit D
VGDGSPQADLVHARRAAHAMGLADLSPAGDETPPEPAAYTPPPVPRRRPPGERIADPDGSTAPVTPVHAPAGLRSLPSAPLTPWEPYPDQTDGGEPDPADGTLSRLRLPQGSPGGRRRSPGRGPSIGLVQAHTLRDLSVVGSLLRAARFRPLRSPDGGPLAVEPQDLREHLRAPLPDRYLALLLDHTARDGADWTPDLDPFLRWAYTRRAGLLVVEVGARDAVSELRAEAFTVRSVLHPALAAALRRPPGRATPLAHGVALLARQIRRALSRQGSALTEIHAVIATDGRANVPLRAALQDRAPDRAVGASAVKDAHAQAAVLGEQDPTRFRPFLLAPPGHGGRRLVQDLAARMGATVLPARGEGRGR